MPPSGRFQAPRCAAHTEKKERAVNDLWERESPRRFAPPLLTRGDFSGRGISGGAFSCSKSHLSREHPHPSGLRPATFPLQGGRLLGGHTGPPLRADRNISERAGEGTRPYGSKRTGSVGSAESGAVVEPQQRQFLYTKGPVARREFRSSLRFCAPEILCQAAGITPVLGSGESGLWA